MSWKKVVLAVVLTLCLSVTQGAQLLLLVPLMQVIGLDVQQGSVGWVANFVASAFAVLGVQPTLSTVLGAFVLFTSGLELITRWQRTFNFKLEEDFVASLRRRLYRVIARTDWLTFSQSRSSDFTHALTTELERVGAATFFHLRLVTNRHITKKRRFLLRLPLPVVRAGSQRNTSFCLNQGIPRCLERRRRQWHRYWMGVLPVRQRTLYLRALKRSLNQHLLMLG